MTVALKTHRELVAAYFESTVRYWEDLYTDHTQQGNRAVHALIYQSRLSVALSFVEMGRMHLIVGLAIATTKAVLVALFFMHLLYSSRLSWTMFLSGLFWLGILLALTLADYLSRDVMSY